MLKKIDYKLVIIYLLLSTGILLKGFFDHDGYLSPDSMNYLRLAQNMLDGNGLFVTELLEESKQKLFAIWPIGYSFFIFLLAKLSFLTVFWASKVVNIITLALIFFILKKIFKDKAFAYGAIFLISPIIEIFAYTWSETVFILGLIWFTASVYYFQRFQSNTWLFSLTAAALFLFLTRYIGAFAVGIIGLLAFIFLIKKQYRPAAKLIGVAGLISASIIGYLYNNYINTGFATGMPRIDSPETRRELVSMLSEAQLVELNPFVIYPFQISSTFQLYAFLVVAIVFLAGLAIHYFRQANKTDPDKYLWLYFLINGLVYWLGIVYMRWTSHFDNFNFRLLGPATVLFIIALLAFIQFNIKNNRVYFNGLAALFFIAFIYNSYEQLVPHLRDGISYQENIETVQEKYQFLPQESILVFGNRHIDYLRTDVVNIRPYFRPYFARQETIEQFITRISEKNYATAIYIEIDQNLNRFYFHESIHAFMKENHDKEFVQLK